MAVTKIHPIKSTLKKALDYITNPAKTEGKLYVSSFGCAVETADIEFEKTRLRAMNKGNNLAHHLIQAFEPGEVTPEAAHEIGRQLADSILGSKYEYVLTTHIDKGHVHNHLIFCAVDFAEHMKVLDLDMDYFMERVATDVPFEILDRLPEDEYGGYVWTERRIRQFLEENLGLSKQKKLPGRVVTGHNESLFFWEELIVDKKLNLPFEVVHIDSHADLGLGCPTAHFLQSAFLTLPIETRRRVRNFEFNGKIKEINIGDYLLWGIAYRMISRITYCSNPKGDSNDYCWDTLKDFHEELIWDYPVSNYIQLTFNKDMDLPKYGSTDEYKKKYLEGAIKDPEVELRIIPTIGDVNYDGEFNFVVLAQSPNYTPASADFIIDIFKEYIVEI